MGRAKSGVRSQKSEGKSQKSEVRSQNCESRKTGLVTTREAVKDEYSTGECGTRWAQRSCEFRIGNLEFRIGEWEVRSQSTLKEAVNHEHSTS